MIPKEIKKFMMMIEDHGYEVYLVGGFVRDYCFHYPTKDLDLTTNALPETLIQLFHLNQPIIQYGSFHLQIQDYGIDLTTFRQEEDYIKGYPSKITYVKSLYKDYLRRDFTINALYMNWKGEIIDPCGGLKDLDTKTLRMIGDPSRRLREDASRILRALRFAARYSLNMDESLRKAIFKEKDGLKNLSKQRIKDELDLLLLQQGFSYLKEFQFLDLLGIQTDDLVYVQDLNGLWAQIETTVDYPKRKSDQIHEKKIKNLLKCGTIKMFDLYHYGYHDCEVAAKIIKFPLEQLQSLWQKMPIHNRKDLALNGKEIQEISELDGKDLGLLIQEIEKEILKGTIQNKKESIIHYLKKR